MHKVGTWSYRSIIENVFRLKKSYLKKVHKYYLAHWFAVYASVLAVPVTKRCPHSAHDIFVETVKQLIHKMLSKFQNNKLCWVKQKQH